MAVALVSALTKTALRHDIAMTGEPDFDGKVLPIGGLKEKVLAAHRHGIHNLIIPIENEKDIPDIPENIRKSIQFFLLQKWMKLSSIPSGKIIKLKRSLPHEKPIGHLKLLLNNLPSASISDLGERVNSFVEKHIKTLKQL